jgi:hypothetical protein
MHLNVSTGSEPPRVGTFKAKNEVSSLSKPQNVDAKNPKMRKRTKTGCLTCRKRRIKCGEERPTCGNCMKSKRQCEGYNQRVIFKTPIENWPNHPGHVSTIQYHTSMLPGTRNQPYQPSQSTTQAQDSPLTSNSGSLIPSWTRSIPQILLESSGAMVTADPVSVSVSKTSRSTNAYANLDVSQLEVVEYLDDDYDDVQSDQDSAYYTDGDFQHTDSPRRRNLDVYQGLVFAESQSALDSYRPHWTGSPLRDESVARFYAVYLHVVAPSLAIYGPHNNSLFTHGLAMEALHDLGLLHASLALSTHHVAALQDASRTPSYKHYAYSLKHLARALTKDSPRPKLSTLGTALLLGIFEFSNGEHVKWGQHLTGLSRLLREELMQQVRARLNHFGSWTKNGLSNQTNQKWPGFNGRHSHRELVWLFAKQDTYHCLLRGHLT